MRAPITLDLHITNFNHPETPAERLLELVSDIVGLTITLPDVHDVESVALAGRTLGAVFG